MNCQFKETDRSGLYIMVLICMLSSCSASDNSDKILKRTTPVACTPAVLEQSK